LNKCLVLAPLVSHATAGRLAALVNTGINVSLLDISTRKVDFNTDEIHPYSKLDNINYLNLKSFGKFYTKPTLLNIVVDGLRSYSVLPENSNLKRQLIHSIIKENPDFIVVFYGPLGMHMVRIIKKSFPNIKLIFIPNLLPSTIVRGNFFVKLFKKQLINEFIDYRRWIKRIDFIFCASLEMQCFLNKKFKYPKSKTAVLPDFHPKAFFISDSLINVDEFGNHDLIFLGAPERWGGQIDNIDKQLNSLSQIGINVYASELLNSTIHNWNSYPYFSESEVFNGELSKFAHQFKAALVTYNISERSERFRTTLPTRFFSALASGIPIAVKEGLFDAVETFVKENGNGFIYKTNSELKEILQDRSRMKFYRENAIINLEKFTAEGQKSRIMDIIKSLKKV
jgi:hypothetical protein